ARAVDVLVRLAGLGGLGEAARARPAVGGRRDGAQRRRAVEQLAHARQEVGGGGALGVADRDLGEIGELAAHALESRGGGSGGQAVRGRNGNGVRRGTDGVLRGNGRDLTGSTIRVRNVMSGGGKRRRSGERGSRHRGGGGGRRGEGRRSGESGREGGQRQRRREGRRDGRGSERGRRGGRGAGDGRGGPAGDLGHLRPSGPARRQQ